MVCLEDVFLNKCNKYPPAGNTLFFRCDKVSRTMGQLPHLLCTNAGHDVAVYFRCASQQANVILTLVCVGCLSDTMVSIVVKVRRQKTAI